MRIAQIAPLYESVPPKLYGGTERVVSYLTEELVRLGHDVTLFASGDSKTSARLVSGCKTALRLTRTCRDPLAYHTVLMGKVLSMADEFDVLHFHTDYRIFRLHAVWDCRRLRHSTAAWICQTWCPYTNILRDSLWFLFPKRRGGHLNVPIGLETFIMGSR